ncbi:hypothetical protein, partial [Desulfuromonas acetoxidans]|uniref:hypothetical protein n=1 Tax=Desulfuromonas acetoxidans TaxID=891 RepID=UPI001A7E6DF5
MNLLTHHWLFNFNARGVGKAHSLFAGANPGDLDFDLDRLWSASRNKPLRRTSSVRIVGTHMTRASAPARRGTFASTK